MALLDKNTERDKCIDLQKEMEGIRLSVSSFYAVRNFETANERKSQLDKLTKKFEDTKCADKIGEFRTEIINGITNTYSELDKARIEAESKYKEKQKIFFGAIIFMGVLLMVTMFGKKE